MVNELLEVKHLKSYFHTDKGLVKAVDDVSFVLQRGEILGIVGESGSGKSVTSQSILRLIGNKKNEEITGEVIYDGINLIEKTEKEMQMIRGNELALIAQDPMTSLNPVYSVGNQIAEVPKIHHKVAKRNAWNTAVEMLRKVGISSPKDRANQFPHQFSGGMRQRGVIAMALAGNPSLLIADEPTTALDVTIQAQILQLIKQLRDETKAGIIMITHDLGVVAETCDSVAVMYAGKIVEKATVRELFNQPKHPYTKGLLDSIPKLGSKKRLTPIKGQPPNLHALPKGCVFQDRCPFAFDKCKEKQPPTIREKEKSHEVSCFLYERTEVKC